MSAPVRKPATLADLEALPPTWRGEIIDGDLHAFPRPAAVHSTIEAAVSGDLQIPFQRGRGGPGGWWILVEPGVAVADSPEFSPDVAGWKRDHLPALPAKGRITVAPDWVCEILSPATRSYDLVVKRAFYARIGVRWAWYIDPEARVLTVSRLEEGKWVELGVFGVDAIVRAEPFDAIAIDLAEWWAGFPPVVLGE
jgi:Uma2 family endonuclease